ncbi:MAG: Brp/Blh family beta-carotene 15,15'-dioxygenase [Desulfobacterales bacterium]|jgi:Brp/Blh family beta-carotene 15,15'-monooxygenase
MNHLNSYEKVTAWHSLTFFGITIATILMSGTGMLDSIGRQLVLLAVLLPFAGIPHGALDYKVAQDTLEHKMGKLWSVSFLTGYVILMATVLLAWQINPSGSLAVFLCITALHFGTGDTLTTLGTPTTIRIADAIGRGGTVLTFPALFFPEDVALLFSYLIAENDARLFTGFLGLMAPLTVLALLSSIGWYIIQFLRYRDNIHLSRMLELIALMAAFSFLPALLAFTIYFSFLHSVRHLLYLAACINADDLTGSLRFTLTRSIPVTVATIGLAVIAYFVLAEAGFDIVRLTQVIFIGIASVTYPHVAVIAVAQRRRILKYQAALLSN